MCNIVPLDYFTASSSQPLDYFTASSSQPLDYFTASSSQPLDYFTASSSQPLDYFTARAHNLWITLQLAAHKQTICGRHHPTITFTVLVLCPYQKPPDIINFTKPFTDLIEYQYPLCIAVGQRKMCN